MGRGHTPAAGRPVAETKRLLLDTATTKSGFRGPRGPRVDRIGGLSGVGTLKTYAHIASREYWFDGVPAGSLSQLVYTTALDGRDHGASAGDSLDACSVDRTVMRPATWRMLGDSKRLKLDDLVSSRIKPDEVNQGFEPCVAAKWYGTSSPFSDIRP